MSCAYQVLTGDGTPVNNKHVESFIITTNDVNIAMIPWIQAGKTSKLSAENTVIMINRCQRTYNHFYEACKDKTGLPAPVLQGSLILNIAASINDHAANETAHVEFISKIKSRVARDLGLVQEGETKLINFYCNTHKAMLLSKALRKADHDFLTLVCPERDDGEFRTSNLLPTFEVQLAKMFGHHSEAYTFGKQWGGYIPGLDEKEISRSMARIQETGRQQVTPHPNCPLSVNLTKIPHRSLHPSQGTDFPRKRCNHVLHEYLLQGIL